MMRTSARGIEPSIPLPTSPDGRSRKNLSGVLSRLVVIAFALALAAAVHPAAAAQPDPTSQLLERANDVRLSNYTEFNSILQSLTGRAAQFSPQQREYLRYLEGWKKAYDGDYPGAIAELEEVAGNSRDPILRFRAQVTAANVLVVASRYEDAFVQLAALLTELPDISDGSAREQALGVAGELYLEVGQYDLAMRYGRMLAQENWRGIGRCKGVVIELDSLFRSGRLQEGSPMIQSGIDACLKVGMVTHATAIRTFAARLALANGHPAQALQILQSTYAATLQTHYPRMISEYDARIAQAYLAEGDATRAGEFASKAVASAVKNQFTQPLVTANQILYQLAKARGDYKAALGFYEQYAVDNLGYLNEVSARQLAYEKVTHENIARQLKIESLSRQNRVLELEHTLAAKEMVATRLYGVILTLVLTLIGLWALLIKRSQVHFKNLSRLDGLTGIANRLHFIEQAEAALAYARKSGQDVCLVLFDLDYFKSINDRFGHATGDFVLKRSATLCREYLRRSDIFGRFGGEEFSVLLPGCRLEEAREQSEQLRRTINGIHTEYRGTKVAVSASFGIASSAVSGYELTRLLAHADAAMYRAKLAGRNCVMAYDTADSGEVKALLSTPHP